MVEASNSSNMLTDSERLQKDLSDFLSKNETLIDYFAILGFDNTQLRKVIHEIKTEVSVCY